jgi:hypothetical protein
LQNRENWRSRVIDDPEEIGRLYVHDFFILSVEVKYDFGQRSNLVQEPRSAIITLGLFACYPRFRIHVEKLAYLETLDEGRADIDRLVVTLVHPMIDLLQATRLLDDITWQNMELRQFGKSEEPKDYRWKLYCLIAGSRCVYTKEEMAEWAEESEPGVIYSPSFLPPQLTVIGERIWVEEISGHSLWP